MKSEQIDKVVREYRYALSASLYIEICRSSQIDHVCRDDTWYDIWTTDGWHWRVTVRPD